MGDKVFDVSLILSILLEIIKALKFIDLDWKLVCLPVCIGLAISLYLDWREKNGN